MRRASEKRQRGDFGELAAQRHLRSNGYRILAVGYEALGYEIDIVAEDKEYVAFVEVKTRRLSPEDATVMTRPASAVDAEKQRHILSAARCWLAAHPLPHKKRCRFDVIEVYLDPRAEVDSLLRVHHIPGAFTA